MPGFLQTGLVVLAAYLIGAIPFGYLVARSRGVDIFREGSGNIGATNVGRILGRRFGVLVFVLDFAKGAIPTAAARWLESYLSVAPAVLPVVAGLAAFVGHMFSVYLRFRGGKGVATGAGVVVVLLPLPALAALIVWVAVVFASRYISLASVAAALAMCAVRLAAVREPFASADRPLTLFCLIAAVLVIVRHRSNIGRLLHGDENRLKDTPTMLAITKTVHVLALGLWFGSSFFFTFVVAPLLFQALPVRQAGVAISPMFPWFFALEGVCGVLALAATLGWSPAVAAQKVHRIRFVVLALALATVVGGWPLAQKVGELRLARYSEDAAVAAAAQASFGAWHTISLLLGFVTLALVTVAMALAAFLPGDAKLADSKAA